MDDFNKLDLLSRFAVMSVVKIAKVKSRFERRYIASIGEICARPVSRGISWEINSAKDHINLARGVIAR